MRRFTAAVLLLTFSLTGCAGTTWVPIDAVRPDLERDSTTVRLTRPDSSQVVLRRSTIRGDSLIGWVAYSELPGATHRRRAYALPLGDSLRAEAVPVAETAGEGWPGWAKVTAGLALFAAGAVLMVGYWTSTTPDFAE